MIRPTVLPVELRMSTARATTKHTRLGRCGMPYRIVTVAGSHRTGFGLRRREGRG